MYHLVGSYDYIKNLSPRHKAILMKTGEFVTEGLESINHNFSEDLVDSIEKVNGSEVSHPLGVLSLRNENNEGLIEFLQ